MIDASCTPPAGTRKGTWHWLVIGNPPEKCKRWWDGLMWRYFPGSNSFRGSRSMTEGGWRYHGPVEPTSTEAPGWDVCQAVAPEPKPQPGDKALLREAADKLGEYALLREGDPVSGDLDRVTCAICGEKTEVSDEPAHTAECLFARIHHALPCDQVNAPTPSPGDALLREAFAEALKRYGPTGDVEGALVFVIAATQPPAKLTDEYIAWAKTVIARLHLRGKP